jgi:hypothetical protein
MRQYRSCLIHDLLALADGIRSRQIFSGDLAVRDSIASVFARLPPLRRLLNVT